MDVAVNFLNYNSLYWHLLFDLACFLGFVTRNYFFPLVWFEIVNLLCFSAVCDTICWIINLVKYWDVVQASMRILFEMIPYEYCMLNLIESQM